MRYLTIFVSSACLVGCGPDWNGTFVGPLELSGTCSDGSIVPTDDDIAQFTFEHDGNSVSWEAKCGATVLATVNDDSAKVRQASCPATTDANGLTASLTIEGGTLELVDNTMRMELELFFAFSGAASATCDATLEGTLNRLEE